MYKGVAFQDIRVRFHATFLQDAAVNSYFQNDYPQIISLHSLNESRIWQAKEY